MKYLPFDGRRHTRETTRRIRICKLRCRRKRRCVNNSSMPANCRRTNENRILVSPFGLSALGGIIAVYFPVAPALFVHFADFLTSGSRLLIQIVGGQGGNYLELPRAGQLRRSLSSRFCFEFYQRKVGPART